MRIFTKLLTRFVSICLVLATSNAMAQVDVTATGGTLTASYTTLNAAFGAINAGTHTGTIDIAITGNTTEPAVSVPLLKSASPSSYTTISIKPSGGNWTINSAAAPTASKGMIELSGADNVTIDGDDPLTSGLRNLSFVVATNASTGTAAIRLSSTSTTGADGADNNTVKNCIITGGRNSGTSTTTSYGVVMSNSTSITTGAYSSLNTVIENNLITRCYHGIYAAGASATYPNTGLIVRNNVFGSASSLADNIGNSCVYLSYTSATAGATSALVEGNTIRSGDISISGLGFSASLSGIELAAANPGAKIRTNTLVVYQPTTSGYGAFGINISSATTNNDIEIYNNMITVGASKYSTSATSSFIANGIRVAVAATLLKINYNTIYVPLHTTGTVSNYTSHGVYVSSTTATIAEFRNNLVVNDNVGTGTYCMYLGSINIISGGVVNYNNYSAASGNVGYLTANQTTLAAWQTATSKDANSVSVQAAFVSATDLHIDIANSINVGFMTAGTPLPITTDIDGQTRSTSTPSIGADEFLVPSCAGQPSAGTLTASVNPVCIGASSLLTATGISSIDGAGTSYKWEESTDSITWTSIPSATGKTYNYTNATGTKYFRFINTCAVSSLADTSHITVNLNNPTYATVPYVQSFDNWISVCGNTDVPGTEWRNNPVTGNNSWRRQDQGATAAWSGSTGIVTGFTGTGAANFHTYDVSSGLSGQLDLYVNMLNPDPIELQFDHLNLTGTDSLFVFFSDDNGTTFNLLAGFGTSATWTKKVVSLGVVLRPQCIVRLQARSDYGLNDIGVDNLTLVNVCAGAPTAGTITASANPICPNTSASLSLTGATLSGGLSYQWLTSTDGVTFSFDVADSNATLNKVLPDSTYFRAVVGCSGVNDTTPIYKVSMKPATQCYCLSNSTSTADTKIDSVFYSTVAKGTLGTICESYTDNRAFIGNMQQTVASTVRVVNGSCSGSHFGAYLVAFVDFNQNGLFTDPGETVYTSALTTGLNTIPTFTVSPPLSATLGQTTMRLVLRESTVPTACGTYGYGETEDYTVNITAAPACTNPPAAGNVYGLSSVCNGTTTTLVDTGYSLGTALQWQVSTNGTTWTNYTGTGFATSTITTAPLVDSAFYRLKVTCVDSSYSNVFKITASPATLCYCKTSLGGFCGGNDITKVQFGTINNTSTCNTVGAGAYTAFPDTGVATTDLYQLVSTNLTVTLSGASIISVWIDFNQNGIFEVSEWTQVSTNSALASVGINVPGSALLGKTGMRIRSRATGNSNGAGDACSNFGSGETEDYIVNILPAPPCTTPALAGTITGPSSATTYSNGQYIVTGAVGTKAWQYAFNPAGPFTQLGITGDTINVALNFVDTVYIRIIASSPGCANDTTLVPFKTVAYLPGNNVCDAVPLSLGTSGYFKTTAANTQVGEPAPASGWLNTTLSNTLWFTFTAPASGRVSVQSPDFDTQLALWDALNCDTILKGGATLIAANDDDPIYTTHGGVQFSSYFTATCLTPGKTYYLQLDPYSAPGDSTRMIITDLGAVNTSFTLDTAYCAGAPVVNLNPATAGGTFTGTGVSGTTFSPATAGVGGPYTITYKIGVCDSLVKTTKVVAAPTANDSITNVSCNGGNNGAIDVTISGVGPFTSRWSNGATTEDLTGLAAGTYTDTITNAIGCRLVFGPRSVAQPSAITLTPTQKNVLCNGGATGKVKLSVAGGTAPYTFLWSTGATADSIDAIVSGSYTATVTDANGCTTTGTYNVTQPTALMAMLDSATNVSCHGGANGAAYASAMGGTSPYTYLWSNATATPSVTGVAAGVYTMTATDDNGCTTTTSATITEPSAIAVGLDSITSPKCNGDSTASVEITVTGGTGALTFAWSNGTTNEDLTNTTGGSYTVSVTDANLCLATATYTISQPATISIVIDSTKNVKCAGQSNGAIYITISGGTGPYTASWSNGSTVPDATGLAAGTYNVTVTDANGCTATAGPVTLTAPAALVVTLDSTRNVKCAGQTTGGVYITVVGGTTAYNYVWSNGPTTQDLTAVVAGTYTVSVTDANGCTGTASSTVTAPTAMVLTTTKTNEFQGGAKGTASVAATGGTPTYTYAWSNGQTTASITNLVAGTYNVTVTDANGCTATSSAVVSFVSGVGNVDLVNAYEVYPNPTSGKFQIAVELAKTSDVKIEIVGSNGQLVKVINERNVDTKVFDVDEEIAAGLYFVKLNFGETQVTKRINVIK